MQSSSKSMFQTMTVNWVILTVIAYGGARFFEFSPDVSQSILIVGIALAAIFMRRGIVRLLDDFERQRQADATAAGQEFSPREPKPLHRSMTVASSILMVAGFFVAKFIGAEGWVSELIMVLGFAAIAIYMRRAMIAVFRER